MVRRNILSAGVRDGLNCQDIHWTNEARSQPLFLNPTSTTGAPSSLPLEYGRYHPWIKRLGEETGFVQVLTAYCLRRATGNAINGKSAGAKGLR